MKKELTDSLSALFLHVLIVRLGQPAFFHITQCLQSHWFHATRHRYHPLMSSPGPHIFLLS